MTGAPVRRPPEEGGFLDAVIRFSLRNRLAVVAAAALVLAYGGFVLGRMPVDVFPDLNRPTVTVMTEAGGLSPEEVETLVTLPLEVTMNGAPGVTRVRSSSAVGLSVVTVEFEWDTDVRLDRQLVAERLQLAKERLPRTAVPTLAPLSSIMGEIMLLGVQSEGGRTSPLDLRTLADWIIRQRLLTIPGVAQVTVMGGGVKQMQVLVDPQKLLAYGLSLDEVERAVAAAQGNTTGGFIERQGQELLVRNLARTASVDDVAGTVVAFRAGVPLQLRQVAEVRLGAAVRRGDAGMNGAPAVVLAVHKQPGAHTLALTGAVDTALGELARGLPPDVKMAALFRQATFIDAAVRNVAEALRDGAALVVVVLLLFLLNLRTTAITLTAIPISFVVTVLVMKAAGISINTMTLGGFAVATGELVDDAIVDVENVFRRLRENRARPRPEPALTVVGRASSEIRGSIVFSTVIVVLVFVPLFAMGGIEGRLFAPLGVAYVVSILASLVVSLTVTPALCALLLARAGARAPREDGFLVRGLKRQDERLLGVTLAHPGAVMAVALALVVGAAALVPTFGREFMPPFNEGTATINVLARPGISLDESDRLGAAAERLLMQVPEVASVGRRTGRAEQDEHAEGVHYTELDVDFRPGRAREAVLDDVRRRLATLVGVSVNIGQPISHRLDHLLSGIRAQIVVKLFGPDMDVLRAKAADVQRVMAGVPGVVDLQVEPQVLIPQLKVRVRRDDARRYGVQPGALVGLLETALAGRSVAQIVEGPRTFDVVVRYAEGSRADPEALRRALVDTPSGAKVPLGAVAEIVESTGPNVINHDNVQRRLAVTANAAGRDLGGVVADVRRRVEAEVPLPAGTFLAFEGQFESRRSASRLIALLSSLSAVAMFVVLYAHFRSAVLVLQVMLNVPLALVGGVVAVWLGDRTLSVATLVGFVTLCGIATRNTIMMIAHYIHLVADEGESFGRAMIVRGSLERLVPVLMTALSAALALVPLVLARGQPGKEILHPVAMVILGGLASSTLLDMAVTPAVFYRFGRRALERSLADRARRAEELAATSGSFLAAGAVE